MNFIKQLVFESNWQVYVPLENQFNDVMQQKNILFSTALIAC